MTDDAGTTVPQTADEPHRRGEVAPPSSTLVVEDVMLILLDDDGDSVRGAGTLYYVLGGALLVELALRGRLELDEDGSGEMDGPVVTVTGEGSLGDPLLDEALATVASERQRVQPLLEALGPYLWKVVLERLVQRGLVAHEERRVLGIFRTTRWPAKEERYEAELRRRVLAVLVDGEEADARTAAVVGLLFASGAMPALSPPIPCTSETVRRATALRDGDWGASAVGTAVERTAAAIAAASAAVAVAVSETRG